MLALSDLALARQRGKMKNKRASISTFLFVLMVIVVCLTSLYAFAKHKSITEREMVGLGNVISSNFQDDVAYLQLKIFSDQAVFYAYNVSLQDYNFKFNSQDGKSYDIFDFSKLEEENSVSELDYSTKFGSYVQSKYDSLVSGYPDYTLSDKEIFLALKNAKIDFDGESITAQTDIHVDGAKKNGIKLVFNKNIAYSSSLGTFGLVDFRKISRIMSACPPMSDTNLYSECVLSQFTDFEFPESVSGFKIVNSSKGDSFYLVQLVSKKSYFVGSGESVLVKPVISFILPINASDESKLKLLFSNSV